MAVVTDTLEGVIDQKLWYHYDLTGDVLYLRLAEDRDSPTTAEEGEDGFLRLYREEDNKIIGLTIVNWWKTQHCGEMPDSIREFERLIEKWREKVGGSEIV